jgi:hypothetical protein
MITIKLVIAALLLTPIFGLVVPGESNHGLVLDEQAVAAVSDVIFLYAENGILDQNVVWQSEPAYVPKRSALAKLLSCDTEATDGTDGADDACDADQEGEVKEGKGKEGKGKEGEGKEAKGKEGKGKEGKGKEGKEGKGKEGKGKEGKGKEDK